MSAAVVGCSMERRDGAEYDFNEPQLSALVDEVFFEYHLRVDDASPPRQATCGKRSAQNAEGRCDTPTDAIELMQKLRRLGIRSHFWI